MINTIMPKIQKDSGFSILNSSYRMEYNRRLIIGSNERGLLDGLVSANIIEVNKAYGVNRVLEISPSNYRKHFGNRWIMLNKATKARLTEELRENKIDIVILHRYMQYAVDGTISLSAHLKYINNTCNEFKVKLMVITDTAFQSELMSPFNASGFFIGLRDSAGDKDCYLYNDKNIKIGSKLRYSCEGADGDLWLDKNTNKLYCRSELEPCEWE